MEQADKTFKNKGGRPVKAVKKNKTLTFKCSGYERMIIQAKAKKVKRSTSEYLREIALIRERIETKEKLIPKEVLDLHRYPQSHGGQPESDCKKKKHGNR